ncbi:hemerythrin domain-containing protein [Pseudaeromonas sp. ZJS20]|uniref:hemerythrin domain-containing protein n=1 Tax=Pseudaeromonas aegiceratis TaxID=3153928 RepID=UPI00390CCE6E
MSLQQEAPLAYQDVFVWGPLYETGLPLMDTQHRMLVELINQLGRYRVEGADEQALMNCCWSLRQYALYHFSCEEQLLEACALSEEHKASHLRRHGEFAQAIDGLSEQVRLDVGQGADALLGFLVKWLALHILTEDMALAESLQQEASSGASRSQGVLIEAISQLFDRLVSQRGWLADRCRQLGEQQRQQAYRLSHEDVLTGLANRRALQEQLPPLLAEAQRTGQPLWLVQLKLEQLEAVNQQLGWGAGDQLLQALAHRLTAEGAALAARLADARFVLVLSPPAAQPVLADYLAHLQGELGMAVSLLEGAASWTPRLQLAAARYPEDGLCAEALLQQTRC